MATVEFTLTGSYVEIASVPSVLTATTVPGTIAKISVADNAPGDIPFDVAIKVGDQLWLTGTKMYFAKSDVPGVVIRVES